MATYEFDVQLLASEITDDLAELVFNAGCDDAVLCKYDRVVYLSFERKAPSRETAVRSALEALAQAHVPFVADVRCAS